MPVLKFWNARTKQYEPVSGPIGVMGDAPGAHVYRSTTQSITQSVVTAVSFDTVLRDSHGYWNAAQPTRLTVPAGQAGWYLAIGGGTFDSVPSATLRWFGHPRKNGAEIGGRIGVAMVSGVGLNNMGGSPLVPVWMDAGDYVDYAVWHNAASASAFGGAGLGGLSAYLALVRQAVGQPGPQGPPGLMAYPRGAAFPGNPSVGDRWTRTDIRGGMDFEWNGTYWLSVQAWTFDMTYNNITATSDGSQRFDLPHDLQVYLIRNESRCYVATTNNASNFWYLEAYTVTEANVSTWRAGSATDTVAADGWRSVAAANIGVLISATDVLLEFRVTKIASPGAAYPKMRLTYRLRAT